MDAFLKMMKAVTGDHRYEEVRKTVRKGEDITMCEVLDTGKSVESNAVCSAV